MDDGSDSDLTAQAKIRNAAIARFATVGFSNTNLRAIAADAGVSASLVIHHFGSKEKLRAVCDDYVLGALVTRARNESDLAGMRETVSDYLANSAEYDLELQYMARAIAEDSPAASRFATSMVDESEAVLRAGMADGSMRPSSDPRALAVLTVMTSLAMLTMPAEIARTLGPEFTMKSAMTRIALPVLEVYTHGLYTDDTLLRSLADLLEPEHLEAGNTHD